MSEFQYAGTELDTFAYATNWKSYIHSRIRRHLVGRILEVGAGIGAATKRFYDGSQERWVCLEPDRALAQQIPLSSFKNSERCEARVGNLADVKAGELYHCILYIDVLEHIQDDAAELLFASRHLEPDGRLVILSPALHSLYTEFDAAIGHYRRYTRTSLRGIAPAGMQEESCDYLDWAGALASLGNRIFLHSASPKKNQILFWDRFLVPISRFTDVLLGHSIGRSILMIWKKPLKPPDSPKHEGDRL